MLKKKFWPGKGGGYRKVPFFGSKTARKSGKMDSDGFARIFPGCPVKSGNVNVQLVLDDAAFYSGWNLFFISTPIFSLYIELDRYAA
jgi:hypothetical protein